MVINSATCAKVAFFLHFMSVSYCMKKLSSLTKLLGHDVENT